MKTITVKGVGKAQASPDLIELSMSVTSLAKTYSSSIEQTDEKTRKIYCALEKCGFCPEDIKTKSFDVDAEYKNVKKSNGDYEEKFIGYSCEQDLILRFDFDMNVLGNVIESIGQSGTNPKLEIDFTLKDPDALNEEMLRNAAKNAREKAEILCDAAGKKLGDLETIHYNWDEVKFYSRTDSVLMLGMARFTPEDIMVEDTAAFVWEII